jgi:hypothetical protein
VGELQADARGAAGDEDLLAFELHGCAPSVAGLCLGEERADGLPRRVRIVDERRFEFAVRHGQLGEARGEPRVRLTASASDLVALRLTSDPDRRARIAARLHLAGNDRAVTRFRAVFAIPEPVATDKTQPASDQADGRSDASRGRVAGAVRR